MPVTCQICNFSTNSHMQMHLIRKHGITPTEYQNRFPGFSWRSEEFAEKMDAIRAQNAKTDLALAAKTTNGKRNKGKRRSDVFKSNRSKAYSGTNNPFYGKKHSLETKIKLSCHFRNLPVADFDGFTKPESFRLTKSGAFKTWRKLVFERDNFTCLLCNKRGGNLEPHHILPRRENRNLVYEITNGATLCVECHKKTFKKEAQFVDILLEKVERRVLPLQLS